ncbi:aspartate aminotransferase family protein [Seongchinamella sediminis]|uniref:Aspartate aminotransferase family protein n=1 Tax=Seongchinamella sediminis TaxID=2283635 RepID=A0A3L7DYQ3_9GAMM|nr:pyridoxal-dependent decarboxylase [Seongchinamella sediminis]RLQ21789.1 aspartate aminotransferase family protein [Seongchinamella sediminis]
MTPEEFRQAGHALIDWIADYRQQLPEQPVLARVKPGEVRQSFPREAPGEAGDFDALLQQLQARVVPGITQVQHPMHFGWFPANASLASVLGDIASSGLGTLGISWESCPALTEVEEVVCDWMRQLTGLSDAWRGTIHDTASTACVTAMILARERASDYSKNHRGLQAQAAPLVVYSTSQAHSSIAKAVQLAGFGQDNLRYVAEDPYTRAMQPEALAAAIASDIARGCVPAAIVCSVGATGTTAMDPVAGIAAVARAHGIWLHVDAAMAGSAMLLPECRHLWQGVEDADSIAWNPHKWMGTILDTALFYVRDTAHLERVMSTNPAYLQSAADGQVTQYRDWGIPLGRRFRALKLWFHLHLDGIDSIRARLRRDLENARWLARQVEAAPQWQVVAPVSLQTVCLRHVPVDAQGQALADEALDRHTLAWVSAINQSGRAFLTPSVLDGRWMVRVSIGAECTTRHHVEALWQLLREAAEGRGDSG